MIYTENSTKNDRFHFSQILKNVLFSRFSDLSASLFGTVSDLLFIPFFNPLSFFMNISGSDPLPEDE